MAHTQKHRLQQKQNQVPLHNPTHATPPSLLLVLVPHVLVQSGVVLQSQTRNCQLDPELDQTAESGLTISAPWNPDTCEPVTDPVHWATSSRIVRGRPRPPAAAASIRSCVLHSRSSTMNQKHASRIVLPTVRRPWLTSRTPLAGPAAAAIRSPSPSDRTTPPKSSYLRAPPRVSA